MSNKHDRQENRQDANSAETGMNEQGGENQQGGAAGITGRAREVMGRVSGTVSENVGHLREVGGQKLHDLREVGGQKLHDAYDKVSHTSISDVQSSVDNYVRQRPVKSLLIALAAGAVLGMLLRGGNRE